MDPKVQDSMRRYYDARAPEYDELYTLGRGSTTLSDPSAYIDEVAVLSDLVDRHCSGRILDLPCGTGFWLPYYVRHCVDVTLIDQSPNMLAQCGQRIATLGIERKCALVRGNAFDLPLARNAFDCALVGFFLSHLHQDQEGPLFEILRAAIRPGGTFLLLDSVWSEERARTRPKAGRQTRTLNDGRSFDIYKRYLDQKDIESMAARHDLSLSILHSGRVFYAVHGKVDQK